LESIVIDTFDDPAKRTWIQDGAPQSEDRTWIVQGSKFATKEGDTQYPILKFVEGDGTYPEALFGSNPAKLPLKSIGVYSKFNRKGYNNFEIYPAAKDSQGNLVPQGIALPGVVKMIDIWVWGSNYRLYLDAYVRDYRGVPYVLHFGSLDFQGWKDLQVSVPSTIHQAQSYLPQFQGLHLTKLVVTTDPTEKVDGFFVYFDQLKILTDMHQSPYDGKGLNNPAFINKYFADSASTTSSSPAAPAPATAAPAATPSTTSNQAGN